MLANGGILDGVRVLKQSTVTMMTTNQLTGSAFPVRFDDPWPGWDMAWELVFKRWNQAGWMDWN